MDDISEDEIQRETWASQLDDICNSAGIGVVSQSSAASFLSFNTGELGDFDGQDSVQVVSRDSFSDWEKVEDTNEDSDLGSFLPVLEAKPKSLPKHNLAMSSDGTRSGSAGDGYNASAVFGNAWNTLESRETKQFWETGFWANIFTNDDQVDSMFPGSLKRPFAAIGPETNDLVSEPTSSVKDTLVDVACHFSKVVKHSTVLTWKEEREAKWETAIRRWHAMIMSWDPEVRVVAAVSKGVDFKNQCQVLVDIFYNKAPSTLLKRCASLSRLTNFLHDDDCTFPCSEEVLYRFFNIQRSGGAPASRLKSILEALVFARHVLGVTELDECINSRRCFGVTCKSVGATLKQATPLKVSQLLYLHKRQITDTDVWNRLFIGALFFGLYGRGRWSDCQHGEAFIVDRDEEQNLVFIEVQAGVHKTARALHLRYVFLPMVAPCKGVDGGNWGEQWIEDRKLLRCDDLKDFPLMPSPNNNAEPTARPLSTAECGAWLRMLLEEGEFRTSDAKYTSHSLKCTFLSYLAKRGVAMEDRRILGYHTDGNRVPLTYSRDGAARPLSILESLISEISKGEFMPDSTRSGRLKSSQLSASNPVIKIEDDETPAGSLEIEVEDSDSHVTTSSSSEEEDDSNLVIPQQRFRDIMPNRGTDMWQHTKLKTLHLSLAGYKNVLLCGRMVADKYQLCGTRQRFDVPKCKNCFNSKLPDP